MGPTCEQKKHPFRYRRVMFVLWLIVAIQVIHSNLKQATIDYNLPARRTTTALGNLQHTSSGQMPAHQDYFGPMRRLETLVGGRDAWSSMPVGVFGVLFAEAGKKKKKEKSEVVVISVQNPPAKGHYGGMYPIFVPSCGHGHGGYGHGGYGRRKRAVA